MKSTTLLFMLVFALTPVSALAEDAPRLEWQASEDSLIPRASLLSEGANPDALLREATQPAQCELAVKVRITGFGGTITDTSSGTEAFLADKHWTERMTHRIPVYETVSTTVGPDILGLNPITKSVTSVIGYEEVVELAQRTADVRIDVDWDAEYIEVETSRIEAYVTPLAAQHVALANPNLVCHEPVLDALPTLDGSGYDYWHTHVGLATITFGEHEPDGHHGFHFIHHSGWHTHHIDVDIRAATEADDHLPHGGCGLTYRTEVRECNGFLHGAIHRVFDAYQASIDVLDQPAEEPGEDANLATESREGSESVEVSPWLPSAVGTSLLLFFTRKWW